MQEYSCLIAKKSVPHLEQMMTVCPKRSRRSKKSWWMSFLVLLSRLPEGSSARMTLGRLMTALAMATRCCSPPESSAGLCSSLWLGYQCRNHDVLECREFGQQVVELKYESYPPVAEVCQSVGGQGKYVGTVYDDFSGIGAGKGAEYLQQGGLAGPAGSHDGYDLTVGGLKVYASEDIHRAETLGDGCGLYHLASGLGSFSIPGFFHILIIFMRKSSSATYINATFSTGSILRNSSRYSLSSSSSFLHPSM